MGDAEDYDAVVLAVDHHADVALLTVLDQVGAQGSGGRGAADCAGPGEGRLGGVVDNHADVGC